MPALRLGLVVVLLVALCGLLVLYGGTEPDPSVHDYPGGAEVVDDYATHVGDRVTLYGTVIETEPVVIEIVGGGGDSMFVTVHDAPPVESGQQLVVHGVLGTDLPPDDADDGVAESDPTEPVGQVRTVDSYVRDQWEIAYMYAVSIVAVLWVVGRAIDGWRFRPREVAFEPRDRTLIERIRDRRGESGA